LVVTHPFHPLAGRRLGVVFEMRSRRGLSFVCEVDGVRRVTLRQEWTDRGPEPGQQRVSVEGLARLREVIDATARRDADPAGEVDHDHGSES
jgi:hypothetical protein